MGAWAKELVLCQFTYWSQYGGSSWPSEQSFMLEVEFSDQLWDKFEAKILEWTRKGMFGSPLKIPMIDFHTAVTSTGRVKW